MPATTTSRPAGNLPAEITSFVGRRREVNDVKQLLSESRLVTLLGVGGAGKTRLALRTAEGLRRAFRDGVWFVELAALEDSELLTQTVCAALGLQNRSVRDSLPTLTEYVRDKHLLLVLDNCEHLRTACAVLAETLLRAASSIRILATSRQALALTGEHIFQVPTLSTPPAEQLPAMHALDQYEAIRLFVDRAAAVQPGFALTEANHATVAQICQRLEGLPLAIELAASRVRVLSLDELLERLEDRYRLLTTGSPGALPRHQTLRALIDWSYELCSEQERTLWARLSVFTGSFDLRAAESVCSTDEIADTAVLDIITGLVEKSIVSVDDDIGHVRYRMLETIRQYGSQRLRETGSEATLRQRHRAYYANLVEQAWSEWFGAEQEQWFAQLNHDHSNLRAALESSFSEDGEPEVGLRLASGLWFFWIATGLAGEGRRWLDRGLQLLPDPCTVRAKALWVDSYLCLIQEDVEAARPKITECATLAAELDHSPTDAWVTQLSGMAALSDGELTTALTTLDEAARKHRLNGDLLGTTDNFFFLIAAVTLLGDRHRAIELCEEALAVCDTHGEQWLKAYILWDLGLVVWQLGDVQRAAASVRNSLRYARLFHEQWAIGFCIEVLAWTAHASRQNERAARLLGGADSIWQRIGAPLFGMRHLINYHQACRDGVQESIGTENFELEFDRGAEFSLDEAIAEALDEHETPSKQVTTAGGAGPTLTARELEVAKLIAEGFSNKDIAATLVISRRTAEAHVEHILNKLGFSSRTQIAAWLFEQQSSDATAR